MKRLWIAFLWLAFLTPAFAQPIQCPDRPTADSTNACANTRFVHSVAGGGGGGGIVNVGPSLLATTATLPNSPVYANGTLGVGATLTAGSNSTLTVDSTVAVLTNIILVKDQVGTAQNGIYTVTNAGSGSTKWVLTRVTYFDQAGEMLAGSYTAITGGVQNLNTAWSLQTTVGTVGTDPVNFILFSQITGYWSSGGGGSGAPIAYNAGRVNIGGTFGAAIPALTTAGVPRNDASGVITTSKDYTTSIVYAANYGVIADGSTNNNTTLANAITACGTLPPIGKGCILQLPCGTINVSTAFSITFGIIVQGCGAGIITSAQSALGGGTVINQTCTTCDTFDVVSVDPPQFRDLGFNASLTQASGKFIYVKPEAVPAANPVNIPIFTRIRTRGGYIVLHCELCGNFVISDGYFHEYASEGIVLTASVALADSGEGLISGMSIQGISTSVNGIRLQTQSAVKIVGSKIIGNGVNLAIIADQGVAGTVLVSSNSFEEVRVNDIRMTIALGGARLGNIIIVGNEFATLATNSFQGNIVSVSSGVAYIDRIIISSNIFVNGAPAPITSAKCIGLQAVAYGMVNNNFCNMNSVANWGGIAVTTNSSGVSVLDNTVVNLGAGAPEYEFTVPTVWRDTNPRTVANLPNNITNGSQGFTSDGNPGSNPCGSGSSGSMAFHQSGLWKCF